MMANISIGSVTLAHNPTDMTVIRPQKTCADVLTYSSVAFFSWGVSIIGLPVELSFSYMDSAEFDDLDDLYKADSPVVFNPQNGSSKTYNVEILALEGKYFRTLDVAAGHFRKDVKITLLILSEAT